ncbi:hypothetical protein FRC00_005432 [Tulasnella sp. 408]|nr:hypothetical protein FRC00_005432 [Tulasnella sp. 408]
MAFNVTIKSIQLGDPSHQPPLLARHDGDEVVLIQLGAEISTNLPHIWNRVGPAWVNAMLMMMGDDGSNSAREEDQSHKPIYRARKLVKRLAGRLENDKAGEASVRNALLNKIHEWLNAKEKAEDLLERLLRVKSTYMDTEDPPIKYNLGILDLPSELVLGIIQIALQDDPHLVTTLSHVNSAFRTFTLSTPTLWTTIDIRFHEKRVSAHLERSRSALLRVRASLTLLTMTRQQGLTKLSTFMKMIQPHAARIASLEMLYASHMWGSYALTCLSPIGALPNLDQFEYASLLHQSFQGDVNMWTAVSAQLHNLSKLRIASSDVTGQALTSLITSSGGPPALPSLTHLALDNESLDEELDLSFSLMDNLTTSRSTLFRQQVDGRARQAWIQALDPVIRRGWNESHIPTTSEFAGLRGLVGHSHVGTFGGTSDDGEATDGEWESLSQGWWGSSDQDVADLGDDLRRVGWGMELGGPSDDDDDMGELGNWGWDEDELTSSGLSEDLGFGITSLDYDPSLNHDPPLDHNLSAHRIRLLVLLDLSTSHRESLALE